MEAARVSHDKRGLTIIFVSTLRQTHPDHEEDNAPPNVLWFLYEPFQVLTKDRSGDLGISVPFSSWTLGPGRGGAGYEGTYQRRMQFRHHRLFG